MPIVYLEFLWMNDYCCSFRRCILLQKFLYMEIVRIGEIRPTWDGWAWPSYLFSCVWDVFSLGEASDGSLLFCCLVALVGVT